LVNGVLIEGADEDVVELEWRVQAGDHVGRRVFQRLKLAGPALSYSINDLDMLGIAIESLDARKLPKLPADPNRPGDRFRPRLPVGVVVGASIGHWTGTDGRARHRIERLVKVLAPAPDLSEFEPGPPAGAAPAQPDRDRDGAADVDGDEHYPGVEWDEGADHGSTPF
jgi:hypothetical protein